MFLNYVNMFNSEDYHYDLCEKCNMSYVHYIWPYEEYRRCLGMNKEELDEYVTKEKVEKIHNEWKNKIKNIALYNDIIEGKLPYGLLDYVVLGDLMYGVDALYNLGFRTSDIEYSEIWYVDFYHPNRINAVLYEDSNQDGFDRFWKKLRNKEKIFYEGIIYKLWLIKKFNSLVMDVIGEIKKCFLYGIFENYIKYKNVKITIDNKSIKDAFNPG